LPLPWGRGDWKPAFTGLGVTVHRKLDEALKIYGSGTGGGIQEGDTPLRSIDELVKLVESNIDLMEKYLTGKGVDTQQVLSAKDFEQLRLIEVAKDAILVNDESKVLFLSLLRLVVNSYTDLFPDPRSNKFRNLVSLYVHIGESIASDLPEVDISDVEKRIRDLIESSVAVKPLSVKRKRKQLISAKLI
jgi:type I restriction enzyme R subunit